MKVYLINLDQDDMRLKHADQVLRLADVIYDRFPAVWAAGMSESERCVHVNRFRWWCAVGRPFTKGEIGCALSHLGVYRKMMDEQIPLACILEDDVVLDERFARVLQEVESVNDASRPQVFMLSNHSDSEGQEGESQNGFHTPKSDSAFRLKHCDWDLFTEGYVINLRAAQAIYRDNYPIQVPCDWWFRWTGKGIIEMYHVFPTVCSQDKAAFASHTVQGGMRLVKDLPLPLFLWHKLKRLVGKGIDRGLMKIELGGGGVK